jgi:hypothetical protein
MRYLLLHCVDSRYEDHPELSAELESTLSEWLAETERTGVQLDGSRLAPPRQAKTVRVRGGEVLVTDGPFAETHEQVAGFDLLECAHLDDVLTLASRHATAAIGMIEIRPLAEE